MGSILDMILYQFLAPLVEFVNKDFFSSAFKNVFFLERMIGLKDGLIEGVYLFICGFAGLLLTLKLLHKLTNVYLFGLDGDDTTPPITYLKSYAKGVVIILTFTLLYGWLYDIVTDLGNGLLAQLNVQTIRNPGGNLFLQNVFFLVYLVMACVIYIQFIMNGCRLLVLRLGMPFACVGLIDNDNGVYNVFVKKIFQTCFTILVQLFLVRLSLVPINTLQNFYDIPYVNVMMSIAIMTYALKVTQDLNELFLTSAASGAGSKMSSLGRGAKSLVGVLKH